LASFDRETAAFIPLENPPVRISVFPNVLSQATAKTRGWQSLSDFD
jgi:hypothetical protein